MDPLSILGIGSGIWSAISGGRQQKKSDQYANRALQQSEREYNERAPLRRQGMQALGQIEAPMQLGNIGFNASNPFAAARGPAASTASLGDWGRMTTPPEEMDRALAEPDAGSAYAQMYAAAPARVRRGMKPPEQMFPQGMQPLGRR